MSESEDIIDLILIKNNITKVMERDNESHSIIIESEEESTSSDGEMEMIPENLKGKFLNKTIISYKAKCQQYIEKRKAE